MLPKSHIFLVSEFGPFPKNTGQNLPEVISAHCGLHGNYEVGTYPGNETVDRLAKEASSLPQDDVSVDVRTITRAVGRSASKAWRRSWNDSLFRRIMGDTVPRPVLVPRNDAFNVHQLGAGHWGRATSYLHRTGRNPSCACQKCSELKCPAAR